MLRSLSPGAREIVDWHRECHGSKRPVSLNPIQVRQLEEAVVDLGVERLRESVEYMAGQGVRELSKAIRAARTKRQIDEGKVAPSTGRNPRPRDDDHLQSSVHMVEPETFYVGGTDGN